MDQNTNNIQDLQGNKKPVTGENAKKPDNPSLLDSIRHDIRSNPNYITAVTQATTTTGIKEPETDQTEKEENGLESTTNYSTDYIEQKTGQFSYLKESVKKVLYHSPSHIVLNKQEQDFCAYYSLGSTEGKPRESYSKAFQTPVLASNSAYRLLKRDKVRQRLAEIKLGLLETAELLPDIADATETLGIITDIARSDMTDFAEWGSIPASQLVAMAGRLAREAEEKGADSIDMSDFINTIKTDMRPFIDFVRLKDSSSVDGRLIKTLKITREGPQITLHDKTKALEALAKYHDLTGAGKDVGEKRLLDSSLDDLKALKTALNGEINILKRLDASEPVTEQLEMSENND